MPTGPQRFQYPEGLDEAKGSAHELVHRLYGAGSPEPLFTGHVSTTTPWPRATELKSSPRGYDPQLVGNALKDPSAHMTEIDPRHLHSTQPSVTAEGVDYYMGDKYRETGTTFADQHQAGNRWPIVYKDAQGRNKLLSGHHRATAALLHGKQFHGLLIQE